MAASDVVVVLCTAPPAVAEALAHRLVDERLCACVNIVPGLRSVFRWQEQVDVADEVLLVCKTTRSSAERLEARLTELHPYDVPEVLVLAVAGGLPAYLEWVRAAVLPGA